MFYNEVYTEYFTVSAQLITNRYFFYAQLNANLCTKKRDLTQSMNVSHKKTAQIHNLGGSLSGS